MNYKGMDKDMKCRGFQYEVGKEFTSDQMAAYKAISKKYTLPPIEACTFGSVLGCVVTVEWPGYGAMYSTVTGKVVKPYKV